MLSAVNIAAAGISLGVLLITLFREPAREHTLSNEPLHSEPVELDTSAVPGTHPESTSPADQRSLELSSVLAEMSNMAGEVQALKQQISVLELRSEQLQVGAKPSSLQDEVTPPLSLAEEFLASDGTGDRLANVEAAFRGNNASSVDLLTSDCIGDMCRMTYTLSNDVDGSRSRVVRSLATSIAEQVGNVDVFFENEGGESVVYVRLAE